MRGIDLHCHTTFSDGTLTPTEVVELAVQKDLAALAITDHDSTEGVSEAKAAAEKLRAQGADLRVIAGTELSLDYNGIDIHTVGLGIDPMDPQLVEIAETIQMSRLIRNRKMAKNLWNDGYVFAFEELFAGQPDAVPTRGNFANVLVQHGYAKDPKDAFERFLGKSGKYYERRQYYDMQKGIEAIHHAGGIAIIAHPLIYKFSKNEEELRKLIEHMVSLGVDGIEAYYTTFTNEDSDHIKTLAHQYGLKISGGSDFHGANKPQIMLGEGFGNLNIPESVLWELGI